jgi:hypothetical protein
MIRSGITRGTDKALEYFATEGNIYFALYEGAGKDPVLQNFKGKYEDIDECIEKLKNYFNCITPDPKTIYVLKWWDEKPEFNKGKVITSCEGSLKFITNTDDEVNEYVAGYRERVGNYNNAILSRLEAIEQKISNDDQDEDIHQNNQQGLAGIVNNPEFQSMIVQYIGAIVDRIIPIKKQSVAINGIDDNKLEQALTILKKHDPELENDLMILAEMAETNPGQFKFLLSMLRK